MPQFARPDSDVSLGGWSNPSFSTIDEAVADDGDFTQSGLAPATDTLEVSLSDVSDPLVNTGHIIRFRYQKDVAAGSQINLTVALFQGGTEIVSQLFTDIANGFVQGTITLTAAQADAITNYNDLRLRFIATQV